MAGRHRAPRNTQGARDFAVIATATTTAITPWLYPSSASAEIRSTDNDWNEVAQCESSNRWNLNTGTKYFGGLQFLQSTWREFGGLQFAPRADLATPAQQIAIAERVLAKQGKGAWPVCGRNLSASANTNTDRVTQPDTTAKRAPALPPSSSTPPSSNASGVYIVAPGDTLSSIAQRFSTTATQLAQLNSIRNPNLIFPGTRLRVIVTAPAQIGPGSNSPTSSSPTQTKQAQQLISNARTYLGTLYLYGGSTRRGIDCSALVQNSFRQLGKSVPRTADAQMRASRIVSRESIVPGTLAFSVGSNGRAYHVAIYIGNNRVIEAPRSGLNVRIAPLRSSFTRFGTLF